MFKRLLILLAAFTVGFVLAACGSSAPVPTPNAAVSLDGVWKTNPEFMEATVANQTITIQIVTKDSKSLFWKGTAPSTVTDGQEFISAADIPALKRSLMGSSETSKTFKFEGGELTYDFSMLGTTKRVHTSK